MHFCHFVYNMDWNIEIMVDPKNAVKKELEFKVCFNIFFHDFVAFLLGG